MSGKEILAKYPITNTKWKYSHHKLEGGYDGYYYCWLNDIVTGPYSIITTDPWYRAFKDYVPISDDVMTTQYHTTVEGNDVLLLMYKKKFV